ncbi:thiamine-phosphate kinase [Paracerasibacillus soli]|uniref:Thiamine-phosphate kinase n=1 Tax=Paracerasibacillus soli TaxID=480284 RepID=A0ABU5CW48_9BACI|nr:thiamine-phosphate kinase [Virgibacillus soli]MDY0410480.1 thiamine-phosphate kinase [Virgibacillus soli]
MDEFQFIESIKPIYYKQPSLIKGVGDDAAVIRNTSEDMVTSVDVFVEGVHFTKQTMRPYHVGYRALAANISDLAAMGALPAFYLVAVTIPKTWHPSEVREVYDGMAELAKMFKMDLIGGDTVSGKSFSLSITVMGYVEKDKPDIEVMQNLKI